MNQRITLLLWTLLLCLSLSTLSELSANVRKLAILIGNNQGLEEENRLNFAEMDAGRVARILEKHGEFKERDIYKLLGGTSSDLYQLFEDVENKIKKIKDTSEVFLFFYFSGHSTPEVLEMNKTEVPFQRIKEFLMTPEVKVKFAIFDSCYSGVVTGTKGAHMLPLNAQALEHQLNSSGFAILTSSSANELSSENVRFEGSVFTHYLLQGLDGAADFTKDGEVSISELYQYTYNQTVSETIGKSTTPQHPTFHYNMKGKGEVSLTAVPVKKSTLHFSNYLTGEGKIYDQLSGVVLSTFDVSKQPTIQLASGKYQIKIKDYLHQKEGVTHIEIEPHETLGLKTTDFKWQPLKVKKPSSLAYKANLNTPKNKPSLATPHLNQNGFTTVSSSIGGGFITYRQKKPGAPLHSSNVGYYSHTRSYTNFEMGTQYKWSPLVLSGKARFRLYNSYYSGNDAVREDINSFAFTSNQYFPIGNERQWLYALIGTQLGVEWLNQVLYGDIDGGGYRTFNAYNYLIGASCKVGSSFLFRYFNVFAEADAIMNYVKSGVPMKRRGYFGIQFKMGLEYLL